MSIQNVEAKNKEKMVTGGELVVRALKKKGVKYIFTLSGGHIAPIYQHLMDSDIKVVDTRHEQAAVFMADAYARMTGEVGVALVTAGPGFTNALTGVANARMAGSPVLLISGRIGLRMEERLDLQEIAQREVIDPIVKWSKVVTTPARIPEFIDIAMKTAISSSPGPTFIDLPVDVQGETVPLSTAKFLDSPTPLKAGGDPKSIAEAAKIIEKAKRPMVIAGSGAAFSKADKNVLDLVEAAGLPIFSLSMGRGIVSEDHPLSFGPAVVIRPGAAGSAITQTDCVILLGTRINLYTMYGALFPQDAKIIHVNIDPVEIGRNRNVSVGIMGDVGVVADQLKDALKGKVKKDQFSSWVEELKKQEAFSCDSVKEDINSEMVPIHPQRLMKEIDEFLGNEGIVTADGGDTQTWIGMMRKSYGARRFLESGMFGCLGVGIPFAVTAKLLNPKEKVLCATGDGSLGFNFMEINTAMRFNLPIVIVVSNDLGWGMIRHSQGLKFGGDRRMATELGDVDYHKMVEAMGGYAERVTKPEEIKPALKRAFDSGKVSLINVMTHPDIISPGSYALATIAASGY
jgi:acetolactate synthase-1/2/3 large subunit